MWKQKINFNLAKMGHKSGYCLQNVRLGYGLEPRFKDAKEDYEFNKRHNAIHNILTVPLNCAVPVYADTKNVHEHILVSINGNFYSDGVLINKDSFKYFGWGEYCEGIKVVEEVKEMKYVNGSTIEPVYSDSNCTQRIGAISPRETCDCLGVFANKAIVRYRIDGSSNYKIGFVKWLAGVK